MRVISLTPVEDRAQLSYLCASHFNPCDGDFTYGWRPNWVYPSFSGFDVRPARFDGMREDYIVSSHPFGYCDCG